MYKNAKVINIVRDGETYGVDIASFEVNFSKIMERKNDVVSKLRLGVEKLMSDYGIKVLNGVGRYYNYYEFHTHIQKIKTTTE